jgi:hypothetical protein
MNLRNSVVPMKFQVFQIDISLNLLIDLIVNCMAKIDIYCENGSRYSFEEETGFIRKDDMIMPSNLVQPVFIQPSNEDIPPQLSGLWLKSEGKIICRSGKISPVIDSKNIEV